MNPVSERGVPLCHFATREFIPFITVELCTKWYNLYLVKPLGNGECDVSTVDYDLLDNHTNADETTTGDHVFNPKVVWRLAEAMNWEVDEIAFELLVGRWEIEHREKYP